MQLFTTQKDKIQGLFFFSECPPKTETIHLYVFNDTCVAYQFL